MFRRRGAGGVLPVAAGRATGLDVGRGPERLPPCQRSLHLSADNVSEMLPKILSVYTEHSGLYGNQIRHTSVCIPRPKQQRPLVDIEQHHRRQICRDITWFPVISRMTKIACCHAVVELRSMVLRPVPVAALMHTNSASIN